MIWDRGWGASAPGEGPAAECARPRALVFAGTRLGLLARPRTWDGGLRAGWLRLAKLVVHIQ
jgi:hypothetical protein